MKTLDEQKTQPRISKTEHLVKFKKAHSFFNDPKLPARGKYLDEENPYSDSDGLIEFIVANTIVENSEVMETLQEQKKIMVALTSIVTDYVLRYAEAYGEEFKNDPTLWVEAANNLPLMGPGTISKQSYNRHIEGVRIAVEFIQMILDIATENTSGALDKFKKFLEKQGESIRLGVDSKDDKYSTFTLGVAMEVFMVGDNFVYTPKIKQYKIDFDRSNYQVSFGCGSYEKINIEFKYDYAVNVFDYQSLEDKEIKEAFDAFVKNNRKAQIEKSDTFFSGEFPPKLDDDNA